MILIIDYGMGNLGSVQNMLRHLGAASKISSDLQEIDQAHKILLPGVGAFDEAVKQIDQRNLRSVLIKKARVDKIPFLGICLGMQLLTRGSEEGNLPGLDLIPGRTVKFSFPGNSDLKIPHMGWNYVKKQRESKLTQGFKDDFRFYFVHSYKVVCDSDENSILKTNYGFDFDSGIQSGNVYGAQFHPEKSHKFGMQLLTNFVNL
jgi:glutamine amidotransferase